MGPSYRSPAIGLTVALLVVVGATWLVHNRSQVQPAGRELPRYEDRLAQLEERQATQEQKVNARLARIENRLGAMDSGPFATRASPDGGAPDPDHEAAVMRDETMYRQMFSTDPRGTDAVKSESALRDVFAGASVRKAQEQPTTADVVCHQRICAVRAVFAPGMDGDDWLTRVQLAVADDFGNSRIVQRQLPSGDVEITAYLFRKGAEGLLVAPAGGL